MAVQACVNTKMIHDDSDDEAPIVFKRRDSLSRQAPVNSELRNSPSVRSDKPTGKQTAGSHTSHDHSSSIPKGKVVQSSKPSSSNSRPLQKSPSPAPPGKVVQSSKPSSLNPRPLQKSPSPAPPGKVVQSSKASSSNPRPLQKSPSPAPPGKVSPLNSPPSRSAPLKSSPLKSPPLRSPPPNSGASTASQSQKDLAVKKEKPSFSDSDSEDEKPLSSRLAVGSSKNSLNTANKGVGSFSRPTQPAKSKGTCLEDSDDEKPLSMKLPSTSNKGASSSQRYDSDDEKPLASKVLQNGSIKRENLVKKASPLPVKRPVTDAVVGQSVMKKIKLSDGPASDKAKQASLKADPDDDDHIPISQRMKKPTVEKKTIPVKQKIIKVSSSSSVKKKLLTKKKVVKNSKYSKSSNVPPGSGDGQKWTTLVHSGVIFPPPYTPHGVKMLYDGKPVDLTPEQEEVATMYAVMLETDYVQKPKFNENFFNDWRRLLGRNHVIQDLKKCDFSPIHEWHLREKEKKKQMSAEEKKAIKEEKAKQEDKYMWAILDGVKERVGNFRVEPPGLFRGRGEHPKMGKLKKRIRPSDITINIGKGAPIPECPRPGERWKEVRHDNTVTWLAYWNDPINPKEFKYVFLAASSSLKGQSDKEKYEKARKLKDHIQRIRMAYRKDFTNTVMAKQQIAVATYLIDRLALRAGNEKDDDEADTVGCCTLKVENVKPIPPNILEFDFLGKDSIRYHKQFESEPLVFKAVENFRKGKKGSEDLFDELDTSKLNAHLKELMPGLTAKVFRTYNASITLDNMLSQEAGAGDVGQKVGGYQIANKEVAIICNHQRSVSKTHSAQMQKLTDKINELKEQVSELETDLARAKKGKPPLKDSDGKKKRILSPEAIEKKIVQTNAKIEKMERDMDTKEELKEIALGTSKINYLDPRITVAWCKRNEVPIEKIFNKSLLAKFAWAMDAEPDFRF